MLLIDQSQQFGVLALDRTIPLHGIFGVLALNSLHDLLDFTLDLFSLLSESFLRLVTSATVGLLAASGLAVFLKFGHKEWVFEGLVALEGSPAKLFFGLVLICTLQVLLDLGVPLAFGDLIGFGPDNGFPVNIFVVLDFPLYLFEEG